MSFFIFMPVLIPLLNQRAEQLRLNREWQEYEERLYDWDVRVVSRQEYETRLKDSPDINWVGKVPGTVTEVTFESPPHAPVVIMPSLPLPSRSSVQPESQTQSAPVEQSPNDDTPSTLVGISFQSSSAMGILHSSIWRWPLVSRTPALPGKRSPGKRRSTREVSERGSKVMKP